MCHLAENLLEGSGQWFIHNRAHILVGKRAVPIDVRPLGLHKRAFEQALHLVIESDLLVGNRPTAKYAESRCDPLARKSPNVSSDPVGTLGQVSTQHLIRAFPAQGYSRLPLTTFRQKPDR